MKVRRAAVLGIVVFGTLLVQSFAPASAGLRVPVLKPKHPSVPSSAIPSEATEPALQPGATGTSAGTKVNAGDGAVAGSSAATGRASSRSPKPPKTSPSGERLTVKPADDQSPLSKVPWGPVVLVVAFLVTVRRLARLS